MNAAMLPPAPRCSLGSLGLLLLACGDPGARDPFDSATASATMGTGSDPDASATASEGAPTSGDPPGDSTAADTGEKFDVGGATGSPTGVAPTCHVVDDMDAVGPCSDEAPPDAFEPEVQWSWAGDAGLQQVIVIPLVANLTDDDGNGEIDLCDVPDIVVLPFADYSTMVGALYVLDGETGTVHGHSDTILEASFTPALGDIDGDGLPEIVAVGADPQRLIAFEHDLTIKWESSAVWSDYGFSCLALADLDGDGGVEILADNLVFDAQGALLHTLPDNGGLPGFGNATTAADLDGDGDLEILLGRSAWHHDGTGEWMVPGLEPGYPQVADLDDDPQPEVLHQTYEGIALLEHDGTVAYQDLRPTGVAAGSNAWMRPSTVHDFDGDGIAEYAVASQDVYAVYEADASVMWTAPVLDSTGMSGSTAFDFLGDGVAEAMYADEHDLFVYDGDGMPLLTVPRSSGTLSEYPVVADVDNDGSAEILVVSNEGWFQDQTAPALQVIRDVRDRWIPARRIWNQHTYHVTNVREDGTIPAVEPRSWEHLNTFRTQAQIDGGSLCQPDPEG
jgi:hypothetical protein